MGKLIKIYGERNTNTNYISKLINLNLNVIELSGRVPPYIKKLQKWLPGRELVRDSYFAMSYQDNLGWKHAKVKSVPELEACEIMNKNLCILTITKNPYSWLQSLYRNPYHQFNKEKVGFEKFLQTPWKTVGRDNCCKILDNPVKLWNIKNKSYIDLENLNSLNITTEETLQNPEGVIDGICNKFTIDKKSVNFLNYEESTKDKSKNHEWYKNYYLNERWKETLSHEAITIINQSVDRNVMRHFGYEILPT